MDLCDSLQSVRSRTPGANETVDSAAAPDATGDPKHNGLAHSTLADEMDSAALLVRELEQWWGKARRHGHHKARVSNAASCHFLAPVLERTGDVVESLVASFRLPENPLAGRLTKGRVRQH